MEVYYTIPLNYWLTGHPENFKIKLCYFQESLSLQYKKTNFQKDLFFEAHF